MDNPKELEGFRYVGDKRNQLVYEIKTCVSPEKIEDIIANQTYATFGPDELSEARNRGYRLSSCCPSNLS
jgi:hypothetical protein